MLNAVTEVASSGAANPLPHTNTPAAVTEQIRTNGAEQVQTHNVEKIQKEGNVVHADQPDRQADHSTPQEKRANVEVILKQRAPARTDDAAAEANRVSREQAAAAMRRTAAEPRVRDGAAAGGNVGKVDVSS